MAAPTVEDTAQLISVLDAALRGVRGRKGSASPGVEAHLEQVELNLEQAIKELADMVPKLF